MTGPHKFQRLFAFLAVRAQTRKAIRPISINLDLLSRGVLLSWGTSRDRTPQLPQRMRAEVVFTALPVDLCACLVLVRVGVL